MGLEYANLARIWWALLAVPIIVLFILRVRLRRRQVATLLFWDQLLQRASAPCVVAAAAELSRFAVATRIFGVVGGSVGRSALGLAEKRCPADCVRGGQLREHVRPR